MPLLHNPTGHRLFCYRIERFLDAGESVEITDEETADLEGNTVFVVLRDGVTIEPEEPADEVVDEDEAESEPDEDEDEPDEPSAIPRRTTAKRGSKRVEVTKAPEAETRG